MGWLDMLVCGSFVSIYAFDRFGGLSEPDFAPPSRSTTTAFRYYRSLLAYTAVSLVLLALLSNIPELLHTINAFAAAAPVSAAAADSGGVGPAPGAGTVGPASDQLVGADLPAPYIAALAMTVLLPNVPVLRLVDERLRRLLAAWAEIPQQARRLRTWLGNCRIAPSDRELDDLADRLGAGRQELLDGQADTARCGPSFARLVRSYWAVDRALKSPEISQFVYRNKDLCEKLQREATLALREAMFFRERAQPDRRTQRDQQFIDSLGERAARIEESANGLLVRATLSSFTTRDECVRALERIGFQGESEAETSFKLLDLVFGVTIIVVLAMLTLMLLLGSGRAHSPPFAEVVAKCMMIGLVYAAAIGMPAILFRSCVHNRAGRVPDRHLHLAQYGIAVLCAVGCDLIVRFAFKSGVGIATTGHFIPGVKLGWSDLKVTLPYSMITCALALCMSVVIDWPAGRRSPWLQSTFEASLFGIASGLAALLAHGQLGARAPQGVNVWGFAAFVAGVGTVLGIVAPRLYRRILLPGVSESPRAESAPPGQIGADPAPRPVAS